MLDVPTGKVTYSSRSRLRTQAQAKAAAPPSTCQIKELLDGFVAIDEIIGFKCDKCKQTTTGHQRFAFSRLPNVRPPKPCLIFPLLFHTNQIYRILGSGIGRKAIWLAEDGAEDRHSSRLSSQRSANPFLFLDKFSILPLFDWPFRFGHDSLHFEFHISSSGESSGRPQLCPVPSHRYDSNDNYNNFDHFNFEFQE